jgi:hypothetical protein
MTVAADVMKALPTAVRSAPHFREEIAERLALARTADARQLVRTSSASGSGRGRFEQTRDGDGSQRATPESLDHRTESVSRSVDYVKRDDAPRSCVSECPPDDLGRSRQGPVPRIHVP